jgi:hypothetical protein
VPQVRHHTCFDQAKRQKQLTMKNSQNEQSWCRLKLTSLFPAVKYWRAAAHHPQRASSCRKVPQVHHHTCFDQAKRQKQLTMEKLAE